MIENDGATGSLTVRRWWRLCGCYRFWFATARPPAFGRMSHFCPRHGA